MSTAPNRNDLQEVEDHHHRAKHLDVIFGWCSKCEADLPGGGLCLRCQEQNRVIAAAKARNQEHGCPRCEGGGFYDHFDRWIPCRECGATGDARLASVAKLLPHLQSVVANAHHMKFYSLMYRISSALGDSEYVEPIEPEDWDR